MSEEKTFLFLSNCFGEDVAASIIADELIKSSREKNFNIKVYGASLIGDGLEYSARAFLLVFSSSLPPSGGFPTKSLYGFFSDIFAGSLKNILNFTKAINKLKGRVDVVFVVGDVFLLFLARRVFKTEKIIFFALAKSDYFMPHYKIEKKYIKKNVDLMFTRDELTAKNLRNEKINALFLGNPLIDNLAPKGLTLNIKPESKVIGLLPGSRNEAYRNFLLILNLIKKIDREDLIFLAALPKTMDKMILKEYVTKAGYSFSLSGAFPEILINKNKIILTKGYFADVIALSHILIGLAGTANEQAAGKGKPVVSFKGTGPQTTIQRMKEQERLMGGAVKFVENYPDGVIKEVLYLVENEEERKRRGEIGKIRMGEEGGAKRIAEFFLKYIH